MKTSTKYLIIFLLWLMAGFSAFSQGTMLWEKQVPINYTQYLKNSVQSHNEQFWVGIGNAFMPNTTSLGIEVLAYNDINGDTLWRTKIHSQYPVASHSRGIVRGINNHFWAVFSFKIGTGANGTKSALGIAELDHLGQILSVREYFRDCRYIEGVAIEQMPDGGCLVVGNILDITNCTSDSDLFALRIDGEGNTIWQNIYPIAGYQGLTFGKLLPNNLLCAVYNDGSATPRLVWINTNTGILLQNASGVTISPLPLISYIYPLSNGGFLVSYSRKITDFPTYISYGNLSVHRCRF